ncbi:ribonuclease H-like domain-containing protein, partial [Tanacetum coccineum]
MYENFSASSQESLDSISYRLQKTVSQLAILGKNISQEDLNFKFLRSLPSEWSMHVVVWRNKLDLGTISFDDLYNNFKIVELVSTLGSSNEDNTANVQVNTDSTNVSTASTNNSTASLKQIHEDDLEEMDLKLQLALLSTIGIIINGSDTVGYDKTKVECFNCHKMGHFARECRNPRSQENKSRNQDSSRRTVNVEESSSKAIGLASVEEQLVFYKKNEGMLCDQIVVLKRDASFNESEINAIKIQIERLKKEKESNQIKIDNFENVSKSLDKLIGSQISDNNKKGVGYNAVAPPPTGLFAGYGVKVKKNVSENSSNEIKKTSSAPIIEDWVSDCDED